MTTLFTIGHSTHLTESFIGLLQRHGITALADVRSHPYSRYFPQYSREALKASLARAQIAYVFLGKELGARSENPACYRQGKARYDLLALEPQFVMGLERLRAGMDRFCIALMCAEKDPLDCHRAVLVARQVHESGTPVEHIHADGHLEKHVEMEDRMLQNLKIFPDMLNSREEILANAYSIWGEKIAYEDKTRLPEEIDDRRAA
ncbi:MAG: DUF488 domain-containing protein [Candidatus Accumulibacter sp.]|jgi:uncharacterized protein (DUF488 family)|nr:DUF488 domain-containing protein [Accumulibacter sp.]